MLYLTLKAQSLSCLQDPNSFSRRVWYWWNVKSEECRQCSQCQTPDLVTAVPCHYVSDTVCVNRSQLEQFNKERRGYYYAHSDYHQQENERAEDEDGEEADGFKVYDSEEPKDEMPEVFGRRKFHRNHNRPKSLTSQIVSQRLNESGQVSFKQKLWTLQSGRSDYGRPTFYSSHVTNNAAVSSDARPVLEVAKVFLGDSKTHGRARQRNFGDIRALFPSKKTESSSDVVTPGAILQPPSTTTTPTITMTTTTRGVTPMVTAVVPSSPLEPGQENETGDGEQVLLALIFCFVSLLVIILLSILAYLILNRKPRTSKFNILDNGMRLHSKD